MEVVVRLKKNRDSARCLGTLFASNKKKGQAERRLTLVVGVVRPRESVAGASEQCREFSAPSRFPSPFRQLSFSSFSAAFSFFRRSLLRSFVSSAIFCVKFFFN